MFAKNIGGVAGGPTDAQGGNERETQALPEDLKQFNEMIEMSGEKEYEEKDSYFTKEVNEMRFPISDEAFDFFKTKYKNHCILCTTFFVYLKSKFYKVF